MLVSLEASLHAVLLSSRALHAAVYQPSPFLACSLVLLQVGFTPQTRTLMQPFYSLTRLRFVPFAFHKFSTISYLIKLNKTKYQLIGLSLVILCIYPKKPYGH